MAAQLTAGAAHELKTALAMVVGYAELLQTRDDPEIRRQAPSRILEAAERLSATLEAVLATAGEDAADEPHADAVATLAVRSRNAQRLLLLSNDEVAARSVARTFPQQMFHLENAPPTIDALGLVRHYGADLVLLDWKSGYSGADILAELKIRQPDLPVIVLSEARDEDRVRRVAGVLGADAVLLKPVSQLLLLAKAHELLSPPLLPAAASA